MKRLSVLEQDGYQCFAFAKDQTNFDPMNAREPAEVVADNGYSVR